MGVYVAAHKLSDKPYSWPESYPEENRGSDYETLYTGFIYGSPAVLS